jgi:hypothetical protein
LSAVRGQPVAEVHAATLRKLQSLNEQDSALGQVALTLAKTHDDGAGLSTAAIARELRATLKELTPNDGGDDFTRLMAALSAEVRDSPQA